MLRTIFILIFAILNSGCAVVGIVRNSTRVIDNPPLTVERAKLNCDVLDNAATPPLPPISVTREQLEEAWGKPDDIDVDGKVERWTYKSELRWNGLFALLVVVPVPLLIPTGHESMVVVISDGLVQRAEVHFQVDQEFGCGLVFIHGGGWACSNGQPDYYSFRSAFCGYDKTFNQPTGK